MDQLVLSPHEAVILQSLDDHGSSVSELARQLHAAPTEIYRAVEKLAERGLLALQAGFWATPTGSGRVAREAVRAIVRDTGRSFRVGGHPDVIVLSETDRALDEELASLR